MTLGDVLAAVALVVTTGFAAYCAMVLSALLFSTRTVRAARQLELYPWKCFLMGLFIGVPWALIGIAVFQIPNPLSRVIGALILMSELIIAAAGSGGMARLVAERVRKDSQVDAPLVAISLGSLFVVGAALLPVVGWLFLGPVLVLSSLGAGFRSGIESNGLATQVQGTEAQ